MDANYCLYPDGARYPLHLAPSTSTSTPYTTPYTTPALPVLTAPTTGPPTPDWSHPDTYPYHLFPPAELAASKSISSISPDQAKFPLPDPALPPTSYSCQQFLTPGDHRSPTSLSHRFPADTMESSASPSSTSANRHHSSRPQLFPEQTQSGTGRDGEQSGPTSDAAAYRPHSSVGNHHPSSASYQSSTVGPALQATHPSADIYRHRSASPWISQQQQRADERHHHQSSLSGSLGYPDSAHAYQASTNYAQTLFNSNNPPQNSYSSYSHHQPFVTSHHTVQYGFPTSASAATTMHHDTSRPYDPYHSPDQPHANLPYGYPVHSQMYQNSSSLLDKHSTSNLKGNSAFGGGGTPSGGATGTLGGNSTRIYSGSSSINSNTKYKKRSKENVKDEQQSQTSCSARAGLGKNGKTTSSIGQHKATASENTNSKDDNNCDLESGAFEEGKTTDVGGGGDADAPKGCGKSRAVSGTGTNRPIVDENTTTLWDLKDGPDGPHGKPPYPYLTLIRIALLSCEAKRLTLQELYDALGARYPFFRADQKGWKNSIRHNLSLNRCFKKETRHILDPGKGSYWYCDPNEEYSTPRIRSKRDDSSAAAARKSAGTTCKKRKAESPNSGEAEGSDLYQHGYTFPSNYDNSYYENNVGDYSLDGMRNSKVRTDQLKVPFGQTCSIEDMGHNGNRSKRHRAISAPSPITPSFFNNLASYAGLPPAQIGNEHDAHAIAVAPFGVTSGTMYNSHIQSQQMPSIFNLSTQVRKYEFPPVNYQRVDDMSSGHHNNHYHNSHPHQMALPGLLNDTVPHSGATDSTFALETPRTIYSGANAAARPATTHSINNIGGNTRPSSTTLKGRVKDENNSASSGDLLNYATGGHSSTGQKDGREGLAGEMGGEEYIGKPEEVHPGPVSVYVFPATQKVYDSPGQTKRVFVNPSGTTMTAMTTAMPTATTAGLSSRTTVPDASSPLQSHRHREGVQGNNMSNNPNFNLLTEPSSFSSSAFSNPFADAHAHCAEETRNRPAPIYISDKHGKLFSAPPSATSPSRHLPTEYDTMFSAAPFGMTFEGSSFKSSSPRKGSFFSGLAAR